MKLSVGMAVYDGFDDLWAVVQALRLYHKDAVGEIVVVDNHPDGDDGRRTRDLMAKIGNGDGYGGVRATYVPLPEPVGTAVPRDTVFRVAHEEAVVCIDSHVLVERDALTRLCRWYEAHPDCRDLIQGPMLYDDFGTFATHFEDTWGEGMWGQWGQAWRCPCGAWRFSAYHRQPCDPQHPCRANFVRLGDGEAGAPVTACPDCGRALPAVAWPGHERLLETAGYVRLGSDPDQEPFEIPAQGLGLFSCRKDAWLGFNPQFRGFGGEEFYIHRKYAAAGRRTLNLPFLRWAHKFRAAGAAPPFPLTNWHKCRNYVLGFTELGLDLAVVKAHFVPGLVPEHEWAQLVANPADPPEWPAGAPPYVHADPRRPAYYGPAPDPATLLAGGPVFIGAAPPTAPAPSPVAPPFTPAQPDPACPTGCGGGQPQEITYPDAVTLEALYEAAAKTPSDINEHCPKLRELAGQATVVVELAARADVSTTALLAGRPAAFTSISPHDSARARALAQRAGETRYEFKTGKPLEVEIPECDLLFIDTTHTAEHLWQELQRHAGRVRGRIACHDTQVFGETGEDGKAGLLPALRRFLRENPTWSVLYHTQANHGLTVISRLEADRKALPGLLKQAWNYGKAKVKHEMAGRPEASEEQRAARLDVCALCDQRAEGRCAVCGCFLDVMPDGSGGKASWKDQECPVGKWAEVERRFTLPVVEAPAP